MRKKVANPLSSVYASGEADEKWGQYNGSVRQSCNRGKLKNYIGNGVRQSGKVWLVTDEVMREVFGESKEDIKMKIMDLVDAGEQEIEVQADEDMGIDAGTYFVEFTDQDDEGIQVTVDFESSKLGRNAIFNETYTEFAKEKLEQDLVAQNVNVDIDELLEI
ncbi:helix-turn-helix domain-containing protein [Tuberibacillus sp. Marseille-P3662]|uniref:helix-turn-helix domain-containing protein n=1 Tax=Tuberibacillus sp. Marseille-P3662 TaxID=1965358 RepID=UPI000A1C89AC|nr:helix-turn-helix domain-containing protein [Tuberibacillus sp. Marseille-P3662]